MAHLTPENRINVSYDISTERSCVRKKFFCDERYARAYADMLEENGYGYFGVYLCIYGCLGFHLYRLKEV